MKPRSPVLGYNHNVRYAGRLWHVQTEDSGVNNPHIFTHLFHEGTILSTKRLDYNPALEVTVVQKQMQTQHKLMLKELKGGAFDEKIGKFFGQPVVREAVPVEDTDPGRKSPTMGDLEPETVEALVMGLNAAVEPVSGPPTDKNMRAVGPDGEPVALPEPPSSVHTAKTDPSQRPVAAPLPSVSNLPRAPAVQRPPARLPPARPSGPTPPPRPAAPASRNLGIGGRRAAAAPAGQASPYGGAKPTAEGVVVARPAVIVGGEHTAVRGGASNRPGAPPAPAPRWHAGNAPGSPPAPKPGAAQDNIFGGDLISEKSLDEVILAYLSEDLNEK